jgi:hypothetical protein
MPLSLERQSFIGHDIAILCNLWELIVSDPRLLEEVGDLTSHEWFRSGMLSIGVN